MTYAFRSFLRRPPFILGVLAVLLVSLVAGASHALAAATVAPLVSYQARLMDPSGFPVADGAYSVRFSLYDAATAGNRLWTASGSTSTPAAVTVNVQNGLFSVLLGDTGQNTLDSVDWNQDELYVGVTISADAEMTPRRRLASAPQAFNARQLQGMFASSTAFGANSLFTINQTSNTSATGTRTALEVRSAGTNNSNDFLFRGVNDLASTVFSINRQGSVTGTGVIAITGVGTSTFAGAVSSTRGEFSVGLTVGGTAVCLASGANCAASGGAQTLAEVSARGSFATSTLQLYGGFVGASSTVTSTFTVLGNVNNTLATSRTFQTVSTTQVGGAPYASVVEGPFMYVANYLDDQIEIFDISNPASPTSVALHSTAGGGPISLFIEGRYLYVVNEGIDSFSIIDISNPRRPQTVATHPTGDLPQSIYVSGRFAYIANINTDSVTIVDVSNPASPATVATRAVGDEPFSVFVTDRYAYVANSAANTLSIIDVTNPTSPLSVSTPTTGLVPLAVTVAGRYAYVANFGADTVSVFDVSDPVSPYIVSTISVQDRPSWVTVTGRYLYVANRNDGVTGTISVVDVNDPTAPVTIGTVNVGSQPVHVSVSGRYAFVSNNNSNTVSIFDVGGIETNGLEAASANLGSITVFGDGDFGNQLNVGSALTVGRGGIFSDGSLAVNSTNTTSTFSGSVSTTNLFVRGRAVCLVDGTQCPSFSATEVDTLATVSARGPFATSTLQLYGGFVGSSSTVTSTFTVLGGTNLQNVTATNVTTSNLFVNGTVSTTQIFVAGRMVCLANGTNCPVSGGSGTTTQWWVYNSTGDFLRATTDTTNVVIGGTSTTVAFMNPLFTLNGQDLFVAGNVGSASSVFTNGTFVAGASTTYGNGYLSRANGGYTIFSNASTTINVSSTDIAQFAYEGIFMQPGTSAADMGGYVTIRGGDALLGGNGGTILISAGNTNFGTGGDVVIQPGRANGLGSGQVYFRPDASSSQAPRVHFGESGINGTETVSFEAPFSLAASYSLTYPTAAGASGTAMVVSDDFGGMSFYSVCLQNGTNCPASSGGTDTLASVSARGQFATSTLLLYGGFVGSSSTVTSTLTVVSNTRMLGNAFVGTSAYSGGLHPLFTVNGNDLFVADSIGSASSIYTNGEFVAGTGTTRYADGYLRRLGGAYDISSTATTTLTVSGTTIGTFGYEEVTINPGQKLDGEGASINLTAGDALSGSTATGGEVIVRSGSSDTFGGRAGSIRLLAGNGSNAVAGDVIVTAGDRSSFGGGVAGSVYINGGAFNTGSGLGGDIFLTPGLGSTGIGQVHIRTTGSSFNAPTLNFYEIATNGSDRIGIRAPADIVFNYTLTLPAFEGSSGTVLATDGFGTMTFAEVCLTDGTGCPAGAATGTLASVSNRGNFATSTLLLYGGFVGASSTVTSTLTVVSNTRMLGNAFVGTSTYGGGLNTAFATNGDDLFVAGNIGSASSVYTNGSFITGSGSTYYSNGLISRQDAGTLRMRTVNGTLALETVVGVIGIDPVIGGSGDVVIGGDPDDRITLQGLIDGGIYPNGTNSVDIGQSGQGFRNLYVSSTAQIEYVSTSLLTVNGNLVCQADGTDCQTTVTASTTNLATVTGASNPRSVVARGSYVYGLSAGNTRLNVYNISDPSYPLLVTSTSLNASSFPVDLIIKDNYLFISSSVGGASGIQIYELTENGFPRFVRNFSLNLGGPVSLVQHANAMYVREGSTAIDILNVADINDITNSSTISISDLVDIVVHNGYLYALQESPTNRLKIYSLVNKFSPNLIADFAIDDDASHLRVQDGMAYISYLANATNEPSLRVYDVSNPFAPVLRSSLNVGLNTSGVQAIEVSGRYLYLGRNDGSDGFLHTIDVASSTHPLAVATTTYGSAPISDFTVLGRYVIFYEGSDLQIESVGGLDLPGLVSAQAQFGHLSVRGTADFVDRVTAHGGLSVGTGGIVSTGPLIVDSLATTTFGAYIDQLLVGSNAFATGTSNYSMVLTYASSATIGGLCIDDTSTAPTCPSNVGASIMSDGPIVTNAFDLAEMYALTGSAEPGDLLVLDQNNGSHVMKSEGIAYDTRVIGIVSTKPGLILGWEGGAQVALTGRVPLKIAMTNGEIRIGDALTSSDVPGYAMKATKPGMIVGYALQDLNATGTAEAFVNVGYHAATVLGTDGSATQLSDDLVLAARGTASSTNPAVDSWGLTLRGNAWDSLASSVVSREFSILNDVISSTSSLLTIRNSNGTSIFTMDEAGNASLNGDLQVGGRLFPSARGSKQDDFYIFLDDQSPTGTYMATNADGWQSMDTYDFAERFYSPDELAPGDLVVVKNTGNHHVQRAWNETDMLVGIVSTKPAFIAGRPATNTHPIALAGRVPTKVSALKGAIKAGDPLAPSTMPGVAVKATQTGPVVGLALEDYAGDAIGMIEVNVNPGWWTAPAEPVTPQTIVQQVSMEGVVRRGMAKIEAGVKKVSVTYESIQSYPFVQVTPRGLIVGAWGTENYTDKGFDIVLSEAQSFDAYFSWEVEPLQAGDRLYQSDGTFLDLNEMTGQPVGGVAPSSTEAVPDEAPGEPTVPTTTEPTVTPEAAPTSTESVEPESAPVAPSSTEITT